MNRTQPEANLIPLNEGIPRGWQSGPLLEFLELQRGVDLPVQERRNGRFPIFGSNGVLGHHDTFVSNGPGVITGRSGTIGKLFYTNEQYWPLNTSLYVKNFKGNLPKFVFYKLDEIGLERFSTGTGVPTLNRNVVHKEMVAFPQLPEQQKIAAILTTVDEKLDMIARQIAATQTLKQGLMQTLFSRGVGTDAGGHWVPHIHFEDSELGAIPAAWTVVTVGDVIQKLMDFRGRTPKKLGLDWGNGCIPALSANNVRMGYVDFERECYLGSDELYRAWMVQGDTQRHDLVFTMEAPLGNVAVLPDDRKYILSQRVILMRPNQRISYRYFFQYLRSNIFSDILDVNSTGTTAKGIQQKRLVKLPVLLPDMAEQEKIADVLGAVDSKLNALKQKQSRFQKLKHGLMQKLLTGEWRVKVDANVAARGGSELLTYRHSTPAVSRANSLAEEHL